MFILRPYLLHKEVGFTYTEVFGCIWDCFKPMIVAGAIAYGLGLLFDDILWQQAILFGFVLVITCVIVWIFMEKAMRDYIVNMIKQKINKNR